MEETVKLVFGESQDFATAKDSEVAYSHVLTVGGNDNRVMRVDTWHFTS